MKSVIYSIALGALFCASGRAGAEDVQADTRPSIAHEIREDESRLKFQDGNFVAVPIPMSNPTLDSGLIAGTAYFYPQTEEQREAQPASVTGLGAMYTNNESKALVLLQQSYWRDDTWRVTGAIGAADIRLTLVPPEEANGGEGVDWRIKGAFLYARLSRRLGGNWYGGGLLRVVDTEQSIDIGSLADSGKFRSTPDVRAAGIGLTLEYDSLDLPTYPTAGSHLKAEALFNDETIGSSDTYQTYTLGYKAYYSLAKNLVLAWELQGCQKAGTTPLWDACRIPLRGFSAFDYLGTASVSGQAEARWRVYKRWGLVAFAGNGWAGSSFGASGENETVTSYGAGIRFEVLSAKRLNLRLDFAESDDNSAFYVSVGEAF